MEILIVRAIIGLLAAIAIPNFQGYIGRGSSGTLAKVVCPSDSGGRIDSSYVIGDISAPPTCRVLGIAQQPDSTKAHILE